MPAQRLLALTPQNKVIAQQNNESVKAASTADKSKGKAGAKPKGKGDTDAAASGPARKRKLDSSRETVSGMSTVARGNGEGTGKPLEDVMSVIFVQITSHESLSAMNIALNPSFPRRRMTTTAPGARSSWSSQRLSRSTWWTTGSSSRRSEREGCYHVASPRGAGAPGAHTGHYQQRHVFRITFIAGTFCTGSPSPQPAPTRRRHHQLTPIVSRESSMTIWRGLRLEAPRRRRQPRRGKPGRAHRRRRHQRPPVRGRPQHLQPPPPHLQPHPQQLRQCRPPPPSKRCPPSSTLSEPTLTERSPSSCSTASSGRSWRLPWRRGTQWATTGPGRR